MNPENASSDRRSKEEGRRSSDRDRPANETRPAGPKRSSLTRKALIAFSFVFSFVVLAWAFTIPFRKSSVRVSSVTPNDTRVDGPVDPTMQAIMQRQAARARQQQAFDDHQNFLDDLRRERADRYAKVPGAAEARQYWEDRSNQMKQDAERLRRRIKREDIPKDGAIAQHLEHLEEMMQDVPK